MVEAWGKQKRPEGTQEVAVIDLVDKVLKFVGTWPTQ